ncbi:amylo-alpha-1,6-glucosidase [Oleiagrimonas sp. C23AA]|uniref:amylo-alpha-1,6-glucosidase n=1 Tax=Oleiagrimonas sp. C23AA TaxID=2719047 RepID=UPI00141F493B|nr:amylo-alpha-1,6-glucosidase [Oleiagrimonas sp. C23AA]NII09861.1 amylo-alpha-1,6-glucosidase [Oleiagrimonas sp. C23AA]
MDANVTQGAATTARSLFALKDGDSFVVCDAHGDIGGGDGDDGLFRDDTRVLSCWRLQVGGRPPSLLSAAVSQDNVFFTAHLGDRPMPHGTAYMERMRFLWDGRLYERIACVNYGEQPLRLPLRLVFAADFHDMMEVRGAYRGARGRLLAAELGTQSVALRYAGLDGCLRRSVIAFSRVPDALAADAADFVVTLPRLGRSELYVEIGAEPARPGRARFRHAAAQARRTMRARRRRGAHVRSSGHLFNAWLERSGADIALLTSELPTGPYPYAGIPWFSTPFGRDAIVTALQTLWLDPALARGVLAFLARHQAHETSAFRDSAPGKIMHETRKGEMAQLQELPFGLYYGGVDTTPLFVMLAGAYAERTGDDAFIDTLWPSLIAACGWIERACDAHPQGWLAYDRGADSGLANQGWKDSGDSVFHADGRLPRAPIALVEVQGYAFAAWRAMAALAERREDAAAAARWRRRAAAMREAVERHFWDPQLGTYGLAIDGDGALCRVRTSNPGHLLYVGLPAAARAQAVIRQFRSPAFDSGWGVRTLASDQVRFNPTSYHNGSVWAHDVALCAAGMARYGDRDGAVRILGELFEAAAHFGMRLPELFCGFNRAAGEPPVAYPVACLPQAWAAGAVFMLLQACLGLRVDGRRGVVHLDRPRLPHGLDRLSLQRLAVGRGGIDIGFERIGGRVVAYRTGGDPGIDVLARI